MAKKLSKAEKSELLNELLGTEIDFTKLSNQDLDTLFQLFNEPSELFYRIIEHSGIETFIEHANKAIKRKIVESKPIRNLLKELLLG